MSNIVLLDGEELDALHEPGKSILWKLYLDGPRKRPPLTCSQPHRGAMYLQLRKERLWAIHKPGQGDVECSVQIGEPEGPAHQHLKEYSARAAEAAGFTVATEQWTGNGTRADVYVQAPFSFSVEAQISPIQAAVVTKRTKKSTAAGVPPVWVATQDRVFPFAPNIGFNREMDWEPGVPPRGTVTALHMKHIVAEHCTAAGEIQRCPNRRSGFCGGYHPHYEALRGWTLDDAIAGVGAGALIFLQDRKGNVRVVPDEDVNLYRELTGHDGVFDPTIRTVKPPADDGRLRECTALRTPEPQSLAPMAERMALDWYPALEAASARKFDFPELIWARCQKCGREICNPESIAAGLCQRHLLVMQAALRRMEVTF
jgi:hypothetical protein